MLSAIAWWGQALTHAPQPVHFIGSTVMASFRLMACCEHVPTHSPQELHRSLSTAAMILRSDSCSRGESAEPRPTQPRCQPGTPVAWYRRRCRRPPRPPPKPRPPPRPVPQPGRMKPGPAFPVQNPAARPVMGPNPFGPFRSPLGTFFPFRSSSWLRHCLRVATCSCIGAGAAGHAWGGLPWQLPSASATSPRTTHQLVPTQEPIRVSVQPCKAQAQRGIVFSTGDLVIVVGIGLCEVSTPSR